MEILPNRVTPMTTLPTLIRNIHGQSEPVLKIAKITPLLELSQKVATKLQQLDDTAKNKINLQGVEDSKALIDQLIQQGGYPFKTEYSGQAGIVAFLTHLNDIMRLAKDAAVGVDVDSTYSAYQNLDDLPVIEVEFYHLKDNHDVAHGSLAILDTPGPNEFGQSDALQVVFTTQLAKASAVLLVTDFTQMNTEADHAVREQLKIIKQQLSKDHLYVIVNKFDNADPSNTSSKDQIKNNVKESVARLIKNYVDIDVSQVFPVSSKSAYLANRAKRHLDQHEKLPGHKQESWVASFAEKALIDLEDDDIGDKDFVKKRIEKLWKNSFFAESIDKVIKEAHADAANRSLDSAIKKLAYYNNEFLNEFRIYSATITKDIKKDIEKIKEMRLQLEDNIASCEQVKNEVTEITSDSLSKLEKEIDDVMSSQKNDIDDSINDFFKNGKELEESRKKVIEIIMNQELNKVDSNKKYLTTFSITANGFESSKNEEKECIKKKYGEQLKKFDTTSKKIIFNDMESSKLYTETIIKNIADI
ncbi:MAG: hypothetical protein Q8Q54_11525, partial [Methylococcales bacterium]|nr:hypothetical protein [Methylococcales bacterium]